MEVINVTLFELNEPINMHSAGGGQVGEKSAEALSICKTTLPPRLVVYDHH